MGWDGTQRMVRDMNAKRRERGLQLVYRRELESWKGRLRIQPVNQASLSTVFHPSSLAAGFAEWLAAPAKEARKRTGN